VTSVIIPADEVRQITGYVQPKRQVAWFAAHGYRATLNARNECIVFRSDLETPKQERPQVKLRHAA
jgi:hypothetical protein